MKGFLLLLMMLGLLLPPRLPGEEVTVTSVEGSALYGKGSQVGTPCRAGQRLGAGTFRTGGNGILYLSTFDDSFLKLGNAGELRYDGTDDLCRLGKTPGSRSTFHLVSGRLEIHIRNATRPPRCYHIDLPHGETSFPQGECVMCRHASDTYLYVAHGALTVWDEAPAAKLPPLAERNAALYGPAPEADKDTPALAGQRAHVLSGDGRVGVVGLDGVLHIMPLAAVTAVTQSCLLAGFNPDSAAGSSKKASLNPDAGAVIVSPTR